MKPIILINPLTNCWDLWITTEGYGGQKYVAKPVVLELEPLDMASHVEPTIKNLPAEFAEEMARALQEKGVKPPAVSYVEGKLESAEKHLEDLRTLLGLKEKS